ncbi:hypothetical protein JOD54_004076 [Actinokineospora baliensis]|nr:hypothetical protein [Actinokineospora baliensis]MBM7773872.1 hypothetical protein [Actinokineospora baliensis]
MATLLAALVVLGSLVESLASPTAVTLAKLLVSTAVLYVTVWSPRS